MVSATKAEFRCHICVANGLKCAGKALPGYKVEGLPVCKVAATYDFNKKRARNFEIIRRLGSRAKGETKTMIEAILNSIRVEVAAIFTGAADPSGKGSIVKAQDRIADLLADARFALADAIFAVAKKASEEHKGQLEPAKAAAVDNVLASAEAQFALKDVDAPKLHIRERRARWGAAKQALVLVEGLPSTIGRFTGISVQRFRAQILTKALDCSLEEAEQLIEQLTKARGEAGAEETAKAPSEEPAEVKDRGVGEEIPEPEVEGEVATVPEPEVQETVPVPDATPLPQPAPAQARSRKATRSGRPASEGGKTPRRRNGPPPEDEDIRTQLEAAEAGADPGLDATVSEGGSTAGPVSELEPVDSPFAALAEAAANGQLQLKQVGGEE